uniref:MARVEL domain-containing protein n=1 Tax=Parastrongyloides trichosuri TaxID=131310 RepID=A0A0N4ZI02_PARTI
MELKLNLSFPIQKPFGIIMSLRMVLSICSALGLIFTYSYRFRIEILLILNVALTVWSIISFLAFILNLQKNLASEPGKYFYIPFAIIEFYIGIFGSIFYGLTAITCIYMTLNTPYYGFSMIILNMITFFVSLGVTCFYALYCLIILAQTQNIKEFSIKEMVIEGDKITYMYSSANEDIEPFSIAFKGRKETIYYF